MNKVAEFPKPDRPVRWNPPLLLGNDAPRGSTKVFSAIAHGDYGVGCALIAADTEDEARALALGLPVAQWSLNWRGAKITELDQVSFNGSPRIIDKSLMTWGE